MSSVSRIAWVIGAIVGLSTVVLFCVPPRQAPPARQNVTIGPLAGRSDTSVAQWIVVDGDVIAAVSQNRPDKLGEFAIGNGLYAAPGLVDMHVHFPPEFLLGNVDLFNLLYLMHGVTSVREMGTIGTDVRTLASEIQTGSRIGPRIFSCGTPLTGSPAAAPFATSIENDADLEFEIDQILKRGADCIKIYRCFPEKLLSAAMEVANVHGLPLVGHLPLRAPWGEVRISDIQHVCDPRCFSLRDRAIEALVHATQTSDVRHTPTLVAFDGPRRARLNTPTPGRGLMPRIWHELLWAPETLRVLGFHALDDTDSFEAMRNRVVEATDALAAAGATIQSGSDTPHPYVVPGVSLHREMELLLQAGLSLKDVWRSATNIPGDFLPLEKLGTIHPGAPADILLFREDPALSLDALDSLEIVIAAGRVYRIKELQQQLQEQIDYIEGPLYEFAIEPAIHAALRLAAKNPRWIDAIGLDTN